MGREIRMVPPNWKHPRSKRGEFQPMYDMNFTDKFEDWLDTFDRIRRGDLENYERDCYAEPGMNPLQEWLQDEGALPNPEHYRPWRDEEATWFQVWETVSEGTPVTPPFATREELVDYLVEVGDDWDRERGDRAYTRSEAEAFVSVGWVPSMIMVNGVLTTGIAVAEVMTAPSASMSQNLETHLKSWEEK